MKSKGTAIGLYVKDNSIAIVAIDEVEFSVLDMHELQTEERDGWAINSDYTRIMESPTYPKMLDLINQFKAEQEERDEYFDAIISNHQPLFDYLKSEIYIPGCDFVINEQFVKESTVSLVQMLLNSRSIVLNEQIRKRLESNEGEFDILLDCFLYTIDEVQRQDLGLNRQYWEAIAGF